MSTHAPPRGLMAGASTLPLAALAVTAVLGVLAPGALEAAGPALLAVAALAGLPHGAADAALLRRGALVAYAVAAALALGVALLVPGPALAVLLLLSVVHFAEGEHAFDLLRGGAGSVVAALAVGWTVVAVPLAAHPDQVRELLTDLSPAVADALLSDPGRGVLLGVTGVLVAASVVLAERRLALEVVLVAVTMVLAPPLAAFGVWFAAWHAVRHTARLLEEQPGAKALARRTALPTVAGAAGLVALAVVSGGVPPAVVLGLLALTVPHAVVVATRLPLRRSVPV